MWQSSWFPRLRKTNAGCAILSARSKHNTSTWCRPRSTKSPLKIAQGHSRLPGIPKVPNNNNKSRNCPCKSPKTLHGARTSCKVSDPAKMRLAAETRMETTSQASAWLPVPRSLPNVSSMPQSLSSSSDSSATTSLTKAPQFANTFKASWCALLSSTSLVDMESPRLLSLLRFASTCFRTCKTRLGISWISSSREVGSKRSNVCSM
mmetsp:Transcript_36980/g.73580  ORF Transcript_36980/g.73580 Transcript_36980/m.73580 type:complete len:206 (-) Transcript_36980:193-810(-)